MVVQQDALAAVQVAAQADAVWVVHLDALWDVEHINYEQVVR
jgi:hypothetical protein